MKLLRIDINMYNFVCLEGDLVVVRILLEKGKRYEADGTCYLLCGVYHSSSCMWTWLCLRLLTRRKNMLTVRKVAPRPSRICSST
jgi:hypothetical protein